MPRQNSIVACPPRQLALYLSKPFISGPIHHLRSCTNHDSHAVENAENVPQTAIKEDTPSRTASYHLHCPVIAIFAEIGPITQMTKAEKEPRNAIRELNCGTRIETKIDKSGTIIRSKATRNCFINWFSGGDPFPSSTEVGGDVISKPSVLSKIMLSYIG